MDAKFFWNRVFLLALTVFSFCLPTKAQISPDGTTATDVNTTDGNNFDLSGGDRAGGNLFHSFGNFSVPNGGSANFLNPTDINNIISRVTGGNISTIDGLIKANGAANLFLINPAGIVFGSGASLNIGGSFLGSTADSLLFNDGTEFSAVNANGKPLLTINAPIGLGIRDNPNPININSQAGLRVQPGKSVTLVGGNLSFDGGKIFAPGGRVELGSLLGTGKIGISENGSLSFPNGVARGDISLTDRADISVLFGSGGSISVNAKDLELTNKSRIRAGIGDGLGSVNAQAGDIVINASDTIFLDDSSITNQVNPNAVGNSGGISISSSSLTFTNGGQVIASTFGQGDAGVVSIKANDTISFDGEDSQGSSSAARSQVKAGAIGNAGGIDISTGSLFLTNGGLVTASTSGQGNAGSVSINATNTIAFDGEDSGGFPTGAYSRVESGAMGNAGGINISTDSLYLTDGGVVNASTSGQGNAGSVSIKATDAISFDGNSSQNVSSSARSQVEIDAVGNAGGISISTGSLSLTNGGLITASTFGRGNAGLVSITAKDTIAFDGEDSGGFPTGARSQVFPKAVGNAGGINISTGSLFLTNGGAVNASTLGRGDAGLVSINATDTISLDGEGSGLQQDTASSIRSRVEIEAVGNAGGVTISADSLSLTNGGFVSGSSFGQGNAGLVSITAKDTIAFDGKDSQGIPSGAFSTIFPKAVGNAGGVTISADSLSLTNEGVVNANAFGKGNSGDIKVTANNLILNNGSIAATNEPSAQASQEQATREGGNITLEIADNIFLRNNSTISAKAGSNARGGNLTINADNGVIVAFPNQNNDITANAFQGKGGNINIATQAILGLKERRSNPSNQTNDIDASSEFGLEGSVSIKNPDVNPTKGVEQSPQNIAEPDETVAQSCGTNENGELINSFTITGRGGMPEDPTKPLNSVVIAGSSKDRESGVGNRDSGIENRDSGLGIRGKAISLDGKNRPLSSEEIIPARGAIVNEKGQVVLTRYPTPNTTERNYSKAIDCNRQT
jgi:filamentous hemagglutinin family protein